VATLERLRKVDAAELRFRLVCELRKGGGRLRAAIRAPRWNRGDLAAALRGRDAETAHVQRARAALKQGRFADAHVALAVHFSTRPPRFPLVPATLPHLSREIAASFPDARAQAVARADRMLQGRYDILGYSGVDYGSPPAWHRDAVNGREAPQTFWSRVPYLNPQFGDHKIIWEINRHQHWLGLGRAYQLTGDRRYYEAFVSELEDWMLRNPPLVGVNWASMLELAFRSLSWIWALHFFAPAAVDDGREARPWIVDLLLGLDRQQTHVAHNLSQYFSPNTHLSGEALALFVAGITLPELTDSHSRARLGRRVLVEEATRQVNADGGHAELSAHYHRYSTDFYLLAALVGRRCEDEGTAVLEEAARRQAKFLRAIADDNGGLPQLGDDDGGQLFPICGRPPSDCSDTLCSAAAILDDPALALGPATEESFWFCGEPVQSRSRVTARSIALPSSGYFVSRTASGDHLIFDAGRHGYLNGGHAHADALSVVLTSAGRPLLVDAGTATYTMSPEVRDRFRSAAMHNTVVLDGRPQSEPRGPFHWTSRADARCLVWRSETDFDYVEGIHDGYLPKAHARAILALHGVGWLVADHLLGPEGVSAAAETFWHIHPAWRHVPSERGILLEHADGSRRPVVSSGDLRALGLDEANGLDSYSPAYGRVEPALCLSARTAAALPHTDITFISGIDTSQVPVVERLHVTESPPKGWHGVAFRVLWLDTQAVLLWATETSPLTSAGGSPGAIWGCELATTDARMAVIAIDGNSRWKPVSIAGTRIPTLAGAGRA
jgi:Heparinase II/III-like protein/Heparinase II/III N-terminus